MTDKQNVLLVGMLKSFIAGATGVILALNIVDAEHFSIMTFGGWKHLGLAILVSGVASESRFLNQWANSGSSDTPKP